MEKIRKSVHDKNIKKFKNFGKNQVNGITLIALMITVIVLLILAGVILSLTLGERGIFNIAKKAGENYTNAQNKELADLDNLLESFGKGENLPENTKDTKAGTKVAYPEGWLSITPSYVQTPTGKEVKKSEVVATVEAIADGTGKTIPVPIGFYYVGGNIETGVVISDDERDKNKFAGRADVPAGAVYNEEGKTKIENLTQEEKNEILYGNQFVWIPCNIAEYTQYNWGYKDSDTRAWDTTTKTAEKVQVQKYGGFYVGRFEAGTSKVEFTNGAKLENAVTTNTVTIQGASVGWQNGNFISSNTTQESKPTSKAGEIPYFHADYNTAIEMSERMYKTSTVQSGLITGTMWDTMMKWISEEANNADIKENCKWGNYLDVGLSNVKGRYSTITSISGTNSGSSSAWQKNATGKKEENVRTILTTGSTEEVKKKNLYDIAGNLWEWVDEATYWNSYYDVYSIRGGSFNNAYGANPAVFRGRNFATNTNTNNGFRVAL